MKYLGDAALNPAPFGSGLDNAYPYPRNTNGAIADEWGYDAPAVGLQFTMGGVVQPLVEVDDRFAASMYLVWDPSLDVNGNVVQQCYASSLWAAGGTRINSKVSTCYPYSIPVALGYVTWGYCGDAINTQTAQTNAQGQATGTWKLNCSESLGAPAFAAGSPSYQPANGYNSFPAWVSTVANTGVAAPKVKK